MKIPFLDTRAKTLSEAPALREAFERVLGSKGYILGDECLAFEKELATDLGVAAEGVVSCNSGTDALVLGLKAMGVAAGDEVVLPSLTAVPTVAAVRALHAVPKFAEVDRESWGMDPADALSLVSSKTKAIVPVHLYGNPVDLGKLEGLRHLVLEDVAQAQGGSYRGQALGTWGRGGAYSFYPTKNLGALGDGGAVVLRSKEEAALARKLRFYGQQNRNFADHDLGVNSRLDEMQAAFLRVRLQSYRSELARRDSLRALYLEALGGLPLDFPKVVEGGIPAWHLFVVRLRDRASRDRAQAALEAAEIGSLVHYPVPNHKQKAFERFSERALPITESLCDTVLSLPFHGLLSEAEVARVASALKGALPR